MGQLTKNQKANAEKVDVDKVYSLAEATALVKECSNGKFDATVTSHLTLSSRLLLLRCS